MRVHAIGNLSADRLDRIVELHVSWHDGHKEIGHKLLTYGFIIDVSATEQTLTARRH
jgi:hypothetical protein